MSLIKLGRKPEQGDGVYCVEQLEKNLQRSFFSLELELYNKWFY